MYKNRIIIYCHGDAYIGCFHNYPLSMLSKLSQLTGCVAISIDYKLPPEFPLRIAVEEVLIVYKWLCDHDKMRSGKKLNITSNCPQFLLDLPCDGVMSKKIVIAGDSAGGNLCLLALQAINGTKALKMPCCGWSISPWTYLPGFERKRNEILNCLSA